MKAVIYFMSLLVAFGALAVAVQAHADANVVVPSCVLGATHEPGGYATLQQVEADSLRECVDFAETLQAPKMTVSFRYEDAQSSVDGKITSAGEVDGADPEACSLSYRAQGREWIVIAGGSDKTKAPDLMACFAKARAKLGKIMGCGPFTCTVKSVRVKYREGQAVISARVRSAKDRSWLSKVPIIGPIVR